MKEFTLMIVGSRDFNDYATLEKVCNHLLSNYKDGNIEVVSGGAKRTDILAKQYANNNGYKFTDSLIQYNKSVGYRRNVDMQQYIATKTNSGIVCFWDGESVGTKYNFKLAEDLQNNIRIFNYITRKFIKSK